jgi:hypothetical protein
MIVVSRGGCGKVWVMALSVCISRYPLGHDRVNAMHRVVESAVTFGAVASIEETYVSYVAVFATTVSSATAWIATNRVFKNELDVFRNMVVVQDTVSAALCTISL